MFDDDCEYDKIPYEIVECDKHRKLNRKMAQKAFVLLKNDGIPPLEKNKNIAVIGPNADDISVLYGNYCGTASRYTTLLRGIIDANEGNVYYAKGCSHRMEDYENPAKEAIMAAQHADVVILCMGICPRMEGEEGEWNAGGDKQDIKLPKVQLDLTEQILALGKPVIFVNVSGSCMDLSVPAEKCSAVLQCFYPGAEGGSAFADILFGKVSPSARLPVSFYKDIEDIPPFEDYSMENRTYKFFKGKCVYNFGHGLTYSDIKETWLDENTAELENRGDFDTDYTVLKFEYIPHKNAHVR